MMLFVPSLISSQSFRLTCRQILEMRQGPRLIPTIHKDVFTLTSPVCIVRDYVILGVCAKSPLSLPHARTLFQPLQLKERRFLSPRRLVIGAFSKVTRKLHHSAKTKLLR